MLVMDTTKMLKKCWNGVKQNLDERSGYHLGNIVTKQATQDLEDWGVDGLRVGIGGGSLCTTRLKT